MGCAFMEEYREKIKRYIVENFDINENDSDFTNYVNLFEYGYIDSLGAIKVIKFMENEFDIEVSKKDLMLYLMNTIDEMACFVERKVEEK